MADIKSAKARSQNMAAIHSKDTKAEIVLRKALWNKGYRYRKNVNSLPGKPDIVLTRYRICIFVDSEFFHGKGFNGGYQSRKYTSLREQLEHSNHPGFWLDKIQNNMSRDLKVNAELKGKGWKVLRFWSRDVLGDTGRCVQTIEETVLDSKLE